MSACLDCPRYGAQIAGRAVRASCCCEATPREASAAATLRDSHPMLNRRDRRHAVKIARQEQRKGAAQ